MFQLKKLMGYVSLPGFAVIFAWLFCMPHVEAQTPVNLNFLADSGAQAYRLSPALLPVMRGFDFGHARSDHHIRNLGVGPFTIEALRTGDRIVVRFRDQNGDDPFEWNADYFILR